MKLPRVAAVHDMSGYGKCSLTIALPVISACGVEVCPLPTALLSSSTNFDGFTLYDFTAEMPAYAAHWKSMGLTFDAVYSGFLGSAQQIAYIKEMIACFQPKYAIVDPVMGDHGVVYKTYTPEMCNKMRDLAGCADIVTPNLTEACILAEQPYATVDISSKGVQALAEKIHKLGAKNVIITGLQREHRFFNCILCENGYDERETKYLPYAMNGTGDLFTSVLTGMLLTGHLLTEAVDRAASFVSRCMEYSIHVDDIDERGVCFEPLLYQLSDINAG